jgi:hypothetical protein
MTHARNRYGVGLVAALALTWALVPVDGRSESSHSPNSIVGAWSVQVTLRNCDTGAPLGPPFPSLVSNHRGGTISENPGSLAFAIGQRSGGHGAWRHLRGRTYSQHMIALILFDSEPNLPGTPGFDPTRPVSPGFKAGWQTVSHTVRMTSADTFESSGTNEFFDTAGVSYRTGCSTAVGRRFE